MKTHWDEKGVRSQGDCLKENSDEKIFVSKGSLLKIGWNQKWEN